MIVLDTHVLIWLVMGDERLGQKSRRITHEAQIVDGAYVSAITPWEIAMIVDKQRVRLGRETLAWIDAALAIPGIVLLPVTPAIAVDAGHLSGNIHGDPSDRLIIATARANNCPLLTVDSKILAYSQAGHVQALDARL